MSYKAFAALKEHVEFETIKKMSPEEINAHFNRQHDRINELENLIREADEYLETNNLTNIGHGSILHKKFKAQTAV